MGWSDDATRNRESWTRANTEYTGLKALERWRQDEITWVQAPETAEAHPRYDHVSPEWARKWPAEEIWVARKR
jgi:hypothetical protein